MTSSASAPNPLGDVDLRELVLGYLVHHCYSSTAALLLDGSHHDQKLQKSIQARSRVLALIRAGLLAQAIQLIDETDSALLQRHKRLRFLLLSQQFIEEIRNCRQTAALSFAQTHLRPLALDDPELTSELQPIVTLLAIKTPTTQSSYLLRQDRREGVAAEVNRAFLASQGLRERPLLEDVAKQLVVVDDELQSHIPLAQVLVDKSSRTQS